MIPSRLPSIPSSKDIIEKAFREANKVQDFYKKSYLDKDKQKSTMKMQIMEAVIRNSLNRILKGYPKLDDLSEFEKNLMFLLLDFREYENALKRLKWTMKKVSELTTETMKKIKYSNDVENVDMLRKAYYGRVSSFIEDLDQALSVLRNDRELIKEIPYINQENPVVAIAGFPNVGKSMLISKLTRLKPEIGDYPFTTKEIGLGIMETSKGKVQVLDVPGILNRKVRNKIEQKALVSIKTIADLVVFLLDPTEECGYSIESQEKLLEEIKLISRDIIEVENKSDRLKRDNQRIKISALTGEGLDKLKEIIEVKLYDGRDKSNSGV